MAVPYSDPSSVSIPVSPEVAATFEALPVNRQDVLKRLLATRLENAVKGTDADFVKLMDKAGREAKRKGLTPEILKQIVDEG